MSKYRPVIAIAIASIGFSLIKGNEGSTCSQTYNETPGGVTCKYCPPGTYLHGVCSQELGDSICTPCPSGHYQQNCNIARSCEPCDDCTSKYVVGGVVLTECTATRPTECKCPAGYYFHNESAEHGVCLSHTTCSLPKWVRKGGTARSDAVCGECPPGMVYVGEPLVGEFQDPCRPESTTQPITAPESQGSNKLTIGLGVGIPVGALSIAVVIAVVVCSRKQLCCFRGSGNANINQDVERNPATNGFVMNNITGSDGNQGTAIRSAISEPNGSALIEETANVSRNDSFVSVRSQKDATEADDLDCQEISSGNGSTSIDQMTQSVRKSKPTRSPTSEAIRSQAVKHNVSEDSEVVKCVRDNCVVSSSKEKDVNEEIILFFANHVKLAGIKEMLRNVEGVIQQKLDIMIDNVKQESTNDDNHEKKVQLLLKFYEANPDNLFTKFDQSLRKCSFNKIRKNFNKQFSDLISSGMRKDQSSPRFVDIVTDQLPRTIRKPKSDSVETGSYRTNGQASEAGPVSESGDDKTNESNAVEKVNKHAPERENERPMYSQCNSPIATDTKEAFVDLSDLNGRDNGQAHITVNGPVEVPQDEQSITIFQGTTANVHSLALCNDF